MYDGIGMSASSLHREPTDSLIHVDDRELATQGANIHVHVHVTSVQRAAFNDLLL